MKELGRRIAMRRKKLKIAQNVFAETLGISNNHMSGIENGKEKPSLALFVRICEALNVTPDYLLLGNMHSGNVSKDLSDLLQLCSEDTRGLIRLIAQYTIEHDTKNSTGDKSPAK